MLQNIHIPTFRRGEDPEEDRALLAELTRSSQAILAYAQSQEKRARTRLRQIANEVAWTASDTSLTLTPCSQGLVRITYIAGYCANASILTLGGSTNTPRFKIQFAAGSFSLVLGDELGGFLLNGHEPRILTNNGAAGLMSLLLTGEIVPDQMEY